MVYYLEAEKNQNLESKVIMTDSIIFDVDGTIWDSTGVVEKAWNDAASKAGMPNRNITADELKSLFGKPMDEIIEALFPDVSPEKRAEFAPFCFENEETYLKRESGTVYEGFQEMLDELSKEYRLFIVSNCQKGYIETVFEATGFGKYFIDYTCPGDTGLLKADNIRLIMERNGLEKTVYVGDTQMDADACKKAEVPIVFAAYGFGTVEEPDYVIQSPMELVDIMHTIKTKECSLY